MKRFVLVASMLVFAFVAPASADVAPSNQYWWHDGCPWFCQGHERPAPNAEAKEESESEEGAAGGASKEASPEVPEQGEAPANEAAAEEDEEEGGAQLLFEGAEPAQTAAEAAKPARKHKKREREQAEREAEQAEHGEPKPGSMWVGVNGGGWGPSEPQEMAPMVKYVRLESGNPKEFDSFQASGIHVDWDDWGPYAHGVSSINDAEYASHLVTAIEADPSIVSVEILNEPDGNWFWGEGANSKANAEAYARLLEAVYNKVEARFGAEHPLLLGAFEEGSTWGDAWWNALKDKGAINGVVVHPYGGTGSRAQSALGNRGQVERAHTYTGLPVYVTEIGWPTATGFPPTGDSLQWPQGEQAGNIYNFVNWARSTGYVGGVFIYGYHDAEVNGPAEYGVVTHTGVKKLGWPALKQGAEGVACTVCS
jgi:hypothetical protein